MVGENVVYEDVHWQFITLSDGKSVFITRENARNSNNMKQDINRAFYKDYISMSSSVLDFCQQQII